jgi:hypothetical protein
MLASQTEGPAVDVATLHHRAAAAPAKAVAVFLDLRVVRRAQRSQIIESIKRRRLDTSRPRLDMVDMRCAAAAAGDGAAIAVALQRRPAQLPPVLGRVIAVRRQMTVRDKPCAPSSA